MIDHAYLASDEGTWTLVLEDQNGTHLFPCEPALLDDALAPWRAHEFEAEVVRAEREAAGRQPWAAFACVSPEDDWVEMMREQGDLLRKREREGAMVDPGDESAAA